MSSETGSRPRPDLLAGVLAALTAFAAGATYANILFGLPGLTLMREQGPELGVLLVPTAAALTMMLILLAAQRFFIPGYLVSAAAAFASIWPFGFIDQIVGGPDLTGVWLVLIAVGGGAVLAGLALATAGGNWQRLAIAIGLTTGVALYGKVAQTVTTRDWPPYAPAVVTCVLAIGAAVAVRRSRARFATGPGTGAVVITVVAGAVVMAAMLIRGTLVDDYGPVNVLANLPDSATIKYSLLAVAALVTILLAWCAAELGGAGLAYPPVVGFGIAVPITPVALGFSSVSDTGWPVVIGVIVLAAALGAFATVSYELPWEVAGVLAAGGGLLLISTSRSVATVHGPYLLMVCGCSFALAAALVRAAGLRAGATAAVLSLATMMLVAQVLGPATLDALRLNLLAHTSQHAVLPSAVAAVALVILFVLSRAGRGTR